MLIPATQWLKGYHRQNLINDGLAAVVVTIMLIPQSLAYALLAGLPAEMGLYASILPLIAYALFGSSRTLSVGPVAVASLMTASAVGSVTAQGTVDYATAATTLALLGGVMLIVMGLSTVWFRRPLFVAPRGVGFYHCLGHYYCAGAAGTANRCVAAGRHAARSPRWSGRGLARIPFGDGRNRPRQPPPFYCSRVSSSPAC